LGLTFPDNYVLHINIHEQKQNFAEVKIL